VNKGVKMINFNGKLLEGNILPIAEQGSINDVQVILG
jgi:hypothetical protein